MDITSDSHSQHISRQFNQELEELKTHLMAMGGLVEKQVQDAVHALLEGSSNSNTPFRVAVIRWAAAALSDCPHAGRTARCIAIG